MASVADRVKETSSTTGTGNFTLSGATTGFVSFNTAFGTNEGFYYTIQLQNGTEWEVGIGYLSGSTTLVRDTVYKSSNSDALVSFSAGIKDVFCSFPARQFVDKGQLAAMKACLAGN